jgi:hypothetical protein
MPPDNDLSASVFDGRTLLGYVIDELTQIAALTPERGLIGLFPDRNSAQHAILINRKGRPPIDHRSKPQRGP